MWIILKQLRDWITDCVKENEEGNSPNDGAHRQQQNADIAAAILGLRKHFEAEADKKEREKQQAHRSYFWRYFREWLTAVVVVVAACFAGAQWRTMSQQQKVMEGQLKEMQSEQRAWVSLTKDSGIEGFSVSAANELRATMRFGLQNTGKNPAVAVFVNAEMSIGTVIPYGSMPAWQAAVCAQPTGRLGVTMFPGSPEPILTVETGLTAIEFSQRKNWDANTVLAPVIAACIVYEDAVTQYPHHTPVAFEIRAKAPKPGSGISYGDIPLKEDEITLRPWIRGNLPPD